MKEIEKMIERKEKEIKILKEEFYATPVEYKGLLERLYRKIENLEHYVMGLRDAKIYFEKDKENK